MAPDTSPTVPRAPAYSYYYSTGDPVYSTTAGFYTNVGSTVSNTVVIEAEPRDWRARGRELIEALRRAADQPVLVGWWFRPEPVRQRVPAFVPEKQRDWLSTLRCRS